MLRIEHLNASQAHRAAELHALGQPDTFLTRLGMAFLEGLYAEMAVSRRCFGFVVLEDDAVLGVATATTNTRQLFRDLVLRRGWRLGWPVLKQALPHPRLLWNVLETLFYPGRIAIEEGEAEWLFVGVDPLARRKGVGHLFAEALKDECKRLDLRTIKATVDKSNPLIHPYLRAEGFCPEGDFTLYGRPMFVYVCHLPDEDGVRGRSNSRNNKGR